MRRARHIVVPVEFWERRDLKWVEKIVLVELDSCGSRSAKSPDSVAARLGLPKQDVWQAFSELASRGLIGEDGEPVIAGPEKEPEERGQEDRIDYQRLLDEWREANPALPQPKAFTPSMKSKVRSLLKNNNCGLEDLVKSFRAVATSDFCNGKNDRGWVATLHWLIADKGGCYQKLVSGSYHWSKPERDALSLLYQADAPASSTGAEYR